jgi:hypothetical protein
MPRVECYYLYGGAKQNACTPNTASDATGQALNLILELKVTAQEKKDLVAFLRVL